ncbi:MAG: DUF2235 domain-containing protein [Natronospirillum sp.]|uniref:DUF2235 domain-containing protein n=1 Tax=Natronospirillum sp. TaxID=2812955 RepID=UPI0025E71742|nr:DUF2235 domain-containing protein [Natronospirillum sp.]MCH8553034.1 DUF2235 domain-containing protein [Natronospirillum sp.]
MKNLVFCCDGTDNALMHHGQPSEDEPVRHRAENTNVAHLYERLPKQRGEQVTRYEPGVGTFTPSRLHRTGRLGCLMGRLFGNGLTENIENGYHFLVEHYEPGDRIFLFGFSRGAYAVRALSGMVKKCGLLRHDERHRVPRATRLYFKVGNNAEAQQFREQYSQPCEIHFIGVWDTISALGYFYRRQRFFNAELSHIVTHGYHALAIDEKRPKYEPELWDDSRRKPHQTIEQVWFAGAHSDVGGGYKDRGLAEISLQWMQKKAEHAGLILPPHHEPEQPPDPLGTAHKPWRTWSGRLLRLLFGGKKPRQLPEDATLHPSVHKRENNQ